MESTRTKIKIIWGWWYEYIIIIIIGALVQTHPPIQYSIIYWFDWHCFGLEPRGLASGLKSTVFRFNTDTVWAKKANDKCPSGNWLSAEHLMLMNFNDKTATVERSLEYLEWIRFEMKNHLWHTAHSFSCHFIQPMFMELVYANLFLRIKLSHSQFKWAGNDLILVRI